MLPPEQIYAGVGSPTKPQGHLFLQLPRLNGRAGSVPCIKRGRLATEHLTYLKLWGTISCVGNDHSKEVIVSTDIVNWLACRDVMRRLDVSQPYVHRLIHQERLRAVRTRLGYLVDPESVDTFETERAERAERKALAC